MRSRPHAQPPVHHRLGVARRHVAGHEVAERRVLLLQEVVAVSLPDGRRGPGLVHVAGHPDAPVVAQRLRHEGQLRLELVAGRDARGVDLRVARVGERRPPPVRPPRRGDVAVHGVGGQVVHVAVAAGGQHHGVAAVGPHLAGEQVPDHDPARLAVLHHDVEHVGPVVQRHPARRDLGGHGLVGAQQQLLAGLAPGVEGAAHLGAAEGPVGQQAPVLPGEGHPLGRALVDDVERHLGQAVDVGLPGPVVAALDGVVEQPVDRVAVVAVVLGRVDAALRGDGVGPAGRVVERERLDPVAQLGQRRRGRRTGQPRAHHQDLEAPLVGRVDQLDRELVVVPLVCDGTVRDPGVQRDVHEITPPCTMIGKLRLPTRIAAATTVASPRRRWLNRGLFTPSVWNAEAMPW